MDFNEIQKSIDWFIDYAITTGKQFTIGEHKKHMQVVFACINTMIEPLDKILSFKDNIVPKGKKDIALSYKNEMEATRNSFKQRSTVDLIYIEKLENYLTDPFLTAITGQGKFIPSIMKSFFNEPNEFVENKTKESKMKTTRPYTKRKIEDVVFFKGQEYNFLTDTKAPEKLVSLLSDSSNFTVLLTHREGRPENSSYRLLTEVYVDKAGVINFANTDIVELIKVNIDKFSHLRIMVFDKQRSPKRQVFNLKSRKGTFVRIPASGKLLYNDDHHLIHATNSKSIEFDPIKKFYYSKFARDLQAWSINPQFPLEYWEGKLKKHLFPNPKKDFQPEAEQAKKVSSDETSEPTVESDTKVCYDVIDIAKQAQQQFEDNISIPIEVNNFKSGEKYVRLHFTDKLVTDIDVEALPAVKVTSENINGVCSMLTDLMPSCVTELISSEIYISKHIKENEDIINITLRVKSGDSVRYIGKDDIIAYPPRWTMQWEHA